MDKINESHLIEFLPSSKRCKTNYIVRDIRKVFSWFREFRDNDCFCNPAQEVYKNKRQLPRIFDANPDLLKSVLDFCRENINTLSVEAVHQFLVDHALPKLLSTLRKERNDDEISMRDLYMEYGLRSLNVKTIQNWMKKIGFKYEPRKKLTTLIHMSQKKMWSIEQTLSKITLNMNSCLIVGIPLLKKKELK